MNYLNKNKLINVTLVLFSVIFFLLFCLLLYRNFIEEFHIVKFIALVIYCLLSIFFLIIIKTKNNLKQNTIIFVLTSIISLYLIEILLLFFLPPNLERARMHAAENAGIYFDKRTKFEFFLENKKDHVPVIVPKSIVKVKKYFDSKNNFFLPLSGIANKKTILCNENGYWATYKSDNFGFNNPQNQWENNSKKIILIGDSFVLGSCVNQGFDIASNLRNKSLNVLNLGMGGNGPLLNYAILKEYINYINSDSIFWFYFEGNDIDELNKEKEDKYLSNYLLPNFSQNIPNNTYKSNVLLENFLSNTLTRISHYHYRDKFKFIFFSKIQDILNRNKLNFIKHFFVPAFANEYINLNNYILFEKILKEAQNLSMQKNNQIYFIYLPEYDRYNLMNYDNEDYHIVKNIVHKLGIKFIDIHKEVFEKEKNPLKLFPFELRGHYNVEGYRKVSEAIYEFISK